MDACAPSEDPSGGLMDAYAPFGSPITQSIRWARRSSSDRVACVSWTLTVTVPGSMN